MVYKFRSTLDESEQQQQKNEIWNAIVFRTNCVCGHPLALKY